ncbi:MAG: hypothetical protein ABSH08_20375 [Tepidisphaeraceae bacterium]|jgi:hypothetical protein
MRTVSLCSVFTALLIFLANAIAAADLPATQPTTMPTTNPSRITWDQAKDHIGQSVTVTGPVVDTHDFGDAAVLNVGKDFPNPDRFTVYIPADKRTGFPADLDNGKTISVTGTLKLYHDVPEIEADAAHIVVINQGPEGGRREKGVISLFRNCREKQAQYSCCDEKAYDPFLCGLDFTRTRRSIAGPGKNFSFVIQYRRFKWLRKPWRT